VVVYKVDRLTRSLADFAKIVDVFDASGVSFVSVTQQFNTTTSMGRLTLNVLLSFAQFEREVTGERIRDKIAASKKKGMWMGGLPPLGYDCRDRKLVANKAEAATVRHVFRRYIELGSVRALQDALAAEGVVGKIRKSSNGTVRGGKPLARGALYHMLRNPIYRGEIAHKDKTYPGRHPAIVDDALWHDVQAKVASNTVERRNGMGVKSPSLLAGLLFDERGERMTPSHAVKKGRRYRYYVSRSLVAARSTRGPAGRRVPAREIEGVVVDRLRAMLRNTPEIMDILESTALGASAQERLSHQAATWADRWEALPADESHAFVRSVLHRVDLMVEAVVIQLSPAALVECLLLEAGLDPAKESSRRQPRSAKETQLTLSIPARLKRMGMDMRMVLDPPNSLGRKTKPDPGIVKLIAKAHLFRDRLLNANGERLSDVAAKLNVSPSYFTRVLRLTFLSPQLTAALLSGEHPPEINALKLERASRLPLAWIEQSKTLGF